MDTLLASDLEHHSRREFLKLITGGALGLFWLALLSKAVGRERLVPAADLLAVYDIPASDPQPALLGRVLDNTLAVYDRPSFSAKLVNMYWRDLVFPINAATIGDRYPEHNRVWYLINGEGYVHSGKVQPVSMRPNPPLAAVPAEGRLVEVTVPYTDTRKDPDRPDRTSYRLFYGTTFWITEVVRDKTGVAWYRIPDDKYRDLEYFAEARHLRPIEAEDTAPLSPNVPPEAKRLEVRLLDQVVVAYEQGHPVFMARTATGGRFIDGDYSTPTGSFITNRQRPSRHMASEDLASASGYDLPGVPWVCYLTLSGISFHGTFWHNDFGRPRSPGCLNLTSQAARWIYRWTQPSVPTGEHTYEEKAGTRVDVVE